MEVKFIKPTIELVEVIASDMRQADVDEVWASHHKTPMESLMSGLNVPGFTVIVTIDDVPCAMLGVSIYDILSGVGVPWLLGTENALKYKRCFLTQVPAVIDEMLNICPRLCNYVHVKNVTSVKWLRRIGFTLDEPLPYGVAGELFHKFYIKRN